MISILLEVDAALGDGCEIWEHFHNFKKSEMSAGLFQHFMDGYMKFYNSPITSQLQVPNEGDTNKRVPNQWL